MQSECANVSMRTPGPPGTENAVMRPGLGATVTGPQRLTVATFADIGEVGLTGFSALPVYAGRPYSAANYNSCSGSGGKRGDEWGCENSCG